MLLNEDFLTNYDYYWLKYTLERGSRESADKVLVGHSLPRFGVNDREIPGLINLAFISQDYYYSARIIERAMEMLPHLTDVVIGTSYYAPFMDLSKAKNEGERSRITNVYGRYFNDYHNINISETVSPSPEESDSRRIYNSICDDYFCDGRDRVILAESDWGNDLTEEERFSMAKKRTSYHNSLSKHTESYEENGIILNKLALQCKKSNITLHMIVFPANRYYRQGIDPSLKEMYEKQIASIPEQFRPKTADLFCEEGFDPVADYVDTDHLNDEGAAKMSGLLNRIITVDSTGNVL
ncbi:hypothetical protein SAMN02910292_00878 [Lachnospiraceae bacterium XBB2008]|nr:hypothetical protein SAMN02910292_00878 [Lachnospiraceae bacterium XBB2008]